jgi:methionyl-tRNA synthetase
MTTYNRILVTSALPYANGLKHIGHLAGAYLPADIYVRYQRAQKRDVVWVCGSDEHGAAITIQAMKEGTTPQAIVDKYHAILQQNFADLGISFDVYHRTSAPLHHETAQEFFTDLNNRGLLQVIETEQFYDEASATFLADRYITGTCPVCANPNAFGDQCERCGSTLSPEELINPRSTISGSTPIKKATSHWYLPLNQYEDFLQKWLLEGHKADWKPSVYGQCKSWIDAGLQPRAVTRDLDWGIKVPASPNPSEGGALGPNALKNDAINNDARNLPTAGKVLYVWFDAPIGYISATKQWSLDTGRDWKPYWYNADTKLVHFIGKDNIVFHCIIFPVMLHLHGNVLPTNVPANEFMNLEGDKMSTSRGWSIEMEDFIADWVRPDNGGPQMADVLRYYLTAIAPETKDSEFTWKGFQDANNSELVSIFGNFVNRTWVLAHKLCSGKIPPLHADILTEEDRKLFDDIRLAKAKIEGLIEDYKFRDAQFEVIELARKGNQYMQKREPWIVAKQTGDNGLPTLDAQKHIDNTMHICLQLCANLAIFVNPFLPNTARKMLHLMKVVEKMLEWENGGKPKLLSTGYSLRPPELLFRKIDDAEITVQLDKLNAKTKMDTTLPQAEAPTPLETPALPAVQPDIVFDDFAKIDLRVGTILAAEKVEKADKLLKLMVDLGVDTRTIVSGIAQHFLPENIVGKQVVVVANLAPRKMRGIESQGMILMAEDAAGKLHFVSPETAINAGAGVK